MADGISGRALALALGVDEKAVRNAVKTGRIPRRRDGKFDLDACRKAWAGNTDPARTKVRKGADLGAHCAPVSPQSAPDRPHPAIRTWVDAREAVALIAAVLKAEGADAGRIDFNAARTAETILRAHRRDLALKVERGELVAVEEVGIEVEREFAEVRTRLMMIPAKLPAKLVGLDLQAIRAALLDEIAEALAELNAPAVVVQKAAARTKRAHR